MPDSHLFVERFRLARLGINRGFSIAVHVSLSSKAMMDIQLSCHVVDQKFLEKARWVAQAYLTTDQAARILNSGSPGRWTLILSRPYQDVTSVSQVFIEAHGLFNGLLYAYRVVVDVEASLRNAP